MNPNLNPNPSSPRVLVVGCGYIGLQAARSLHALGWEVTGLTASAESARKLASEPFRVMACDINDREALAAICPQGTPFDAVLDCVSSGRGGADDYRRVYLDGARSLIETLRPARFLFTSSTSVYAQTDGGTVTEESPALPDRETGRILKATEDRVLAHGGQVARLAGIYGPGRWALLNLFLEGRAEIEGDGSRVINQIHRDDAAAALVLLLTRPAAPGIYNVADDEPVTQAEAYRAFAEFYQQPLPPSGPIDLNRKRGWTSKRVSNAKLRALGWSPRYPSLRSALGSI